MEGDQGRQKPHGDARRHAGLDPRQQGDQVGRVQQKYQFLDPEAPGRRDEEMFREQARNRMCLHQHGRHGGADRRHEHAADRGGSRSDQDDLVTVFRIGNLAALDVEEGIRLKGRGTVAILVIEGQHPRIEIGADLELAKLDRIARRDLDVGHVKVVAFCRDQQGQGRISLVEVGQDQGFGTDRAIDVRRHVEMADGGRHLAQRLDDTGIDTQRRIRWGIGGARELDHILLDVIGQVLVRPAARLAQHEQHGQGDVAGLGEGVRQATIGIQLLVGLEQYRFDLRTRRCCGHRRRCRGSLGSSSGCWRVAGSRRRRGWSDGGSGRGQRHAAGFDQLVNISQTLVALRLGVEHRGGDHLGLGRGQLVYLVRHDFARPRPASDVVEAGLVDGNHGNLVRWRPRCRCHAHVIGLAFEALQQLAVTQNQHDDTDHDTEEPVTFPEACLLHRSPPCVRAPIKTGQ